MTTTASNSHAVVKEARIRASICVLTHNGESFLGEQLQSIAQQMRDDDEIVVVDNDSRDSTRAIIGEFQKSYRHVTVAFLQLNVGACKGFELAAAMTSGRYIFLCDQDDVWLPKRLETQIARLADADMSICNALLVDEQLRSLQKTLFDIRRPRLGWVNLYKNAFVGCTMAFTREALYNLLPFPSGVPMHDWYLAQAAYKKRYRLDLITDSMFLYRRHAKTATATGGTSHRSLLVRLSDRFRLLRYTF